MKLENLERLKSMVVRNEIVSSTIEILLDRNNDTITDSDIAIMLMLSICNRFGNEEVVGKLSADNIVEVLEKEIEPLYAEALVNNDDFNGLVSDLHREVRDGVWMGLDRKYSLGKIFYDMKEAVSAVDVNKLADLFENNKGLVEAITNGETNTNEIVEQLRETTEQEN